MTCGWSGRWRIASWCCATAAWSSRAPPDELFARPQHDYTRALMAAAFTLDADDSGVVGA